MMFYSRLLLSALESAVSKRVSVQFSEDVLKEVILKSLGKPTSSDELSYYRLNLKTRTFAPCLFGQLRPKVKLIGSAINNSELPKPSLPEIAVYGRTNCGKSCLINALCGKFGLSQVKDLPGTTRKLHFYKVGVPGSVILVDMPGYGYSTCDDSVSTLWNEFALSYIKYRESLRLVLILIDCRVGLKRSDLEAINFCDRYKVRWLPVISKCDSLKPVPLSKIIQKIRFETFQFKYILSKACPVSSIKNQNLDELRSILLQFKGSYKRPDPISGNLLEGSKKGTSRQHRTPLSVAPLYPTEVPTDQYGGDATDNSSVRSEIANLVDEDNEIKCNQDNVVRSRSIQEIVLSSVSEIYRNIFPHDLLESLPQEIESHKETEMIPQKTPVKAPTTDLVINSYDSTSGDLMFNLNLSLSEIMSNDQLTPSEPKYATPHANEDLIKEKKMMFESKLASGLIKECSITRPKLGKSYKRAFSLFKQSIPKRKFKYNAVHKKADWNIIYNKWSRWSRKYPHLARYEKHQHTNTFSSTLEPPTKKNITSTKMDREANIHHLRVHKSRVKLRESLPNVSNV